MRALSVFPGTCRLHHAIAIAAISIAVTPSCGAQAMTSPISEAQSSNTKPVSTQPLGLSTKPEDQPELLPNSFPSTSWSSAHRLHVYGWVDGGITTVSNATGLVVEAPTTNRFSNQPLLNAAWIFAERKTTDGLSWGFRSDFYAGSDAALLHSLNHFGPDGRRFGTEVREAYVAVHTPSIFGHSVDWAAGRINFPTGAETVFGAYQKLYSRGYFWIHEETSGTALFATTHVSPTVDVIAGTTMGYSTSFILRGRAPNYLASVLVRTGQAQHRQLIATVYSGPKPIAATSSHAGQWQTLVELQARRAWTGRFSQIFQTSYTTDTKDPGNNLHTSVTHGAFVISSLALKPALLINSRLEWFADTHGTRIGIPGTYSEATIGVTLNAKRWLEIRPEMRGDFAGQASFGRADSSARNRNEVSAGLEVLFKGKLF